MSRILKTIIFVFVLCSEQSLAESGLLYSSRYTASCGIRFRNKSIFSQENYFQDSWALSSGMHWDLEKWSSEALVKVTYEKFFALPRNKKQPGVDVADYHLGVEAGIENRSLLPVGVAFGAVRVNKNFVVSAGDYVVNQSSSGRWSETRVVPSVETWLGLPLVPDSAQMNLIYRFIALSRPADEESSLGIEFRFEF
jgi:hypothetical protein